LLGAEVVSSDLEEGSTDCRDGVGGVSSLLDPLEGVGEEVLEGGASKGVETVPKHDWGCWFGVEGDRWGGEVANHDLVVGHGAAPGKVGLRAEVRAAVVEEV